jgi:hypothetical protein
MPSDLSEGIEWSNIGNKLRKAIEIPPPIVIKMTVFFAEAQIP